LLRIVDALDGGICRVKLPGGCLTAAQAEAIADAAQAYASGVIEATNRANLQIRGVGAERHALIDALLDAELGPREAAGDDVRNLMLSPTAGLDRSMLIDTRPLAQAILHSLQTETRWHALSAKFAVQLDGGEALAMLEHHHDLWLSALMIEDEPWLAFGLAGAPGRDRAAGAVPLADGHALVLAVLERFLVLATPEQTRMREVLACHPDFIDGLALPIRAVDYRRPPAVDSPQGVFAQRQAGRYCLATLAPLGRLDSAALRTLAGLSRTFADGCLRFTPWQGIVLANVAQVNVEPLQQRLQQVGLLVSEREPLSAMIACTGASGCAKGHADTKGDARRLSLLLHPPRAAGSVHLSGCRRSCACAHTAPVTLLATAGGHYDVYFGDASAPGFGVLQARDLSLDAAAAWLDGCSRSDTE